MAREPLSGERAVPRVARFPLGRTGVCRRAGGGKRRSCTVTLGEGRMRYTLPPDAEPIACY